MPKPLVIILLVLLVVFSAFFSGSEIVFAKVNQLRLKRMAEEGNKKAQKAWKMAEDFPVLISTILIGNNLVNIAASSLATILFTSIWPTNGALYAGFIMTAIILVFGEVLPKTIFPKFSVGLSLKFVYPLNIISYVFKPFIFVVTKLIDLISPIWTPKKVVEDDIQGEELINMIETVEEEGFIDNETKELVTSAIEFKDTLAQEIMTPRVDIFAYDIEDSLDNLINDEHIFTYSRVLVYQETIDNVIGILNTKKLILQSLNKQKIDIKSMLIDPIYVHKTKSITSTLKLFKKTGTHIAVVVDEFGGTLGIITLEDVLEEIVGDIWDEMDTVEEEYVQTSNDEFIVDGDMNIDDLFELVDYENDEFECEYSTVGGWCTEVLDNFPKENDTFTYDNLQVTVLKVNGVRVEKVKVDILDPDDDEKD